MSPPACRNSSVSDAPFWPRRTACCVKSAIPGSSFGSASHPESTRNSMATALGEPLPAKTILSPLSNSSIEMEPKGSSVEPQDDTVQKSNEMQASRKKDSALIFPLLPMGQVLAVDDELTSYRQFSSKNSNAKQY